MVVLNRIYTRTGDDGSTRLATGEPVSKASGRVEAYGEVDETNACIGLIRLHTSADPELDAMLSRIQNELFDLGADLATPIEPPPPFDLPRIQPSQVVRLEGEIDVMNAQMEPLMSFILPGGTPLAAHLHLARTVCRRAERTCVRLADSGTPLNRDALKYLNRLSDLLFVACRRANAATGDVLWEPGATRGA